MAQTNPMSFPADDGLEKAILAHLSTEDGSVCIKNLSSRDFHYDENRRLFSFLLFCVDRFDISPGSVQQEANSRSVDVTVPDLYEHHMIGNVDWYIDKLKELSRRRQLITGSQKMIEHMTDTDHDVTIAESEMRHLIDQAPVSGGLVNISKEIPAAMDEFERMSKGEKFGISYGIKALDEITSGFDWGDYVIIAGRPSTGKTTLAMNIGVNVCRTGVPVYLFEIEMTSLKITQRLICSIAGVNLFALKYKKLNQGEFDKVNAMADTIRNGFPFYIESSPFAAPAKIRQKTHAIVAKYGRGVVMIDYIQLMRPDRDLKNKVTEVGEISAGIKGLCTELKMPCIALSQFSRQSETRQGPPVMSDLRDCGGLEQDADTIIALTRSETEEVPVYVLKNRNGPTGEIKLRYKKECFTFSDM